MKNHRQAGFMLIVKASALATLSASNCAIHYTPVMMRVARQSVNNFPFTTAKLFLYLVEIHGEFP